MNGQSDSESRAIVTHAKAQLNSMTNLIILSKIWSKMPNKRTFMMMQLVRRFLLGEYKESISNNAYQSMIKLDMHEQQIRTYPNSTTKIITEKTTSNFIANTE